MFYRDETDLFTSVSQLISASWKGIRSKSLYYQYVGQQTPPHRAGTKR